MEITTEYILCHILRIGCITGRAVVSVFNGRLNLLCTADPQNTLVIHVNTEVVFQVVPDAAVTFIRILHMYLFYLFRDLLVFLATLAQFARKPLLYEFFPLYPCLRAISTQTRTIIHTRFTN